MEEQNNPQQLNIDLKEETATGVYSNLAIITHSQGEFVTDFVQMMPGTPKAVVRSRVIMNAQNAKRLLNALRDNIQKYEENFGVIDESGIALPPLDFNNPSTKA